AAAAAREQRVPRARGVVADRRHETDAGNRDAPFRACHACLRERSTRAVATIRPSARAVSDATMASPLEVSRSAERWSNCPAAVNERTFTFVMRSGTNIVPPPLLPAAFN